MSKRRKRFPCPFEDCKKHKSAYAPTTQERLNMHLAEEHKHQTVKAPANMTVKVQMQEAVVSILKSSPMQTMQKSEIVSAMRGMGFKKYKISTLNAEIGRIASDSTSGIERADRGIYKLGKKRMPEPEMEVIERPEAPEVIQMERDDLRNRNAILKELVMSNQQTLMRLVDNL